MITYYICLLLCSRVFLKNIFLLENILKYFFHVSFYISILKSFKNINLIFFLSKTIYIQKLSHSQTLIICIMLTFEMLNFV